MGGSTQAKSKTAANGAEWRKTDRLTEPFGANGGGGMKLRAKAQGFLEALQFAGISLGGREHITRPFEEDPLVYSAVRMRANAVRQLPLRFYDKDPLENTDAKAVNAGPIVDLFRAPNPHMTASSFFEAGVIHRALTGEDFWLLYDKAGAPVVPDGSKKIPLPDSIFPVDGQCVSHRCGTNGFVDEWRVGLSAGGNLIYKPGGLIQFADYDKDNRLRGLGAVESLLRSLELAYQVERYQEAVLRNSGDPGGTILIDEELTREEEKALEREANEAFGPQNRGRQRVASGKGIKYEQNRLGPKEMEFLELRKWTRGLISTALGVPLPLLGDTTASTYDNMEQAAENFWKGGLGILAYLRSVEDVINGHFLPRIKDERVSKLICRFDTSRVEALQEDHTTKLECAYKLLESVPGMTWNEAVRIVGLDVDPIEQGEHRFVSTTKQPLEKALAEDEPEEPEAPEGDPEPDPDEPTEDPADEEEGEDLPDEGAKSLAVETREAEITAAEADRLGYWKSFESRVLEPGERDLAKRYTRFSRRYEKAQIKRLEDFAKNGRGALRSPELVTKDDDDDLRIESSSLSEQDVEFLNLRVEEWEERMSSEMGPGIDLVFEAALDDMAGELGGISIAQTDPRVTQFLAQQKIKLVEGHNSYLAGRVRSSLLTALQESQSVGTLQEIVRENLPELTDELRRVFGTRDARALTIARTETAHASNGARFMQMKQENLLEHEWVTSGDSAVRGHPSDEPTQFSHYDLDGKTVVVGEVFARSLRHPSDPNAAAGDVINCRCITRPSRPPKE